MATGTGIKQAIHSTHSYGRGRKAGKWHTTCERHPPETLRCALYHYSTKMLEWDYHPNQSPRVTILGTWTGWGSVSDAQGVNAALDALGVNMRYRRDAKGGGPRINPRGRHNYTYARNAVMVSAGGRAINAISPATPYWMR